MNINTFTLIYVHEYIVKQALSYSITIVYTHVNSPYVNTFVYQFTSLHL